MNYRTIFLFSLLEFCGFLPVVSGQRARESVTRHEGVFNGQRIPFEARVQEHFLKPGKSASAAVSLITISYVKIQEANPSARPVIFIFNGGPGASSSPLHGNAFGPWRIQKGKDSSRLMDNPYCLLDQADLVFMDPPGTGYTRVFDTTLARLYWQVNGDAEMFNDVIRRWKKVNHRESSPVFLCGESYGTIRASAMLGLSKDIPVNGAILLSSVFDFSIVAPAPGNDMPYVLYLPGMAALAWYHHKTGMVNIKSPAEAYEAAAAFALKDYLPALAAGIHLPGPIKQEVAKQLSAIIGIPKDSILDRNLRITPKDFQLMLLAAEGKRIGQLNGQITGPLVNPGVKPPFDDPSMSFNPSGRKMIASLFKEKLQFTDTGAYRSLNLEVNSKWDFSPMEEEFGYSTIIPSVIKTVKEQPNLKWLIAGGYYDLATPVYAARYVLEHANIPANRVSYANFPTGHSIFDQEEELQKLAELVRDFIQQQIKGK